MKLGAVFECGEGFPPRFGGRIHPQVERLRSFVLHASASNSHSGSLSPTPNYRQPTSMVLITHPEPRAPVQTLRTADACPSAMKRPLTISIVKLGAQEHSLESGNALGSPLS